MEVGLVDGAAVEQDQGALRVSGGLADEVRKLGYGFAVAWRGFRIGVNSGSTRSRRCS